MGLYKWVLEGKGGCKGFVVDGTNQNANTTGSQVSR